MDKEEFISSANLLLERVGVNYRVHRKVYCTATLFTDIFLRIAHLFGSEKYQGLWKQPTSCIQKQSNVQHILDALFNLLATDLSHIPASAVVNGDKLAVGYLLELFSWVLDYFEETKQWQPNERSNQGSENGPDRILTSGTCTSISCYTLSSDTQTVADWPCAMSDSSTRSSMVAGVTGDNSSCGSNGPHTISAGELSLSTINNCSKSLDSDRDTNERHVGEITLAPTCQVYTPKPAESTSHSGRKFRPVSSTPRKGPVAHRLPRPPSSNSHSIVLQQPQQSSAGRLPQPVCSRLRLSYAAHGSQLPYAPSLLSQSMPNSSSLSSVQCTPGRIPTSVTVSQSSKLATEPVLSSGLYDLSSNVGSSAWAELVGSGHDTSHSFTCSTTSELLAQLPSSSGSTTPSTAELLKGMPSSSGSITLSTTELLRGCQSQGSSLRPQREEKASVLSTSQVIVSEAENLNDEMTESREPKACQASSVALAPSIHQVGSDLFDHRTCCTASSRTLVLGQPAPFPQVSEAANSSMSVVSANRNSHVFNVAGGPSASSRALHSSETKEIEPHSLSSNFDKRPTEPVLLESSPGPASRCMVSMSCTSAVRNNPPVEEPISLTEIGSNMQTQSVSQQSVHGATDQLVKGRVPSMDNDGAGSSESPWVDTCLVGSSLPDKHKRLPSNPPGQQHCQELNSIQNRAMELERGYRRELHLLQEKHGVAGHQPSKAKRAKSASESKKASVARGSNAKAYSPYLTRSGHPSIRRGLRKGRPNNMIGKAAHQADAMQMNDDGLLQLLAEKFPFLRLTRQTAQQLVQQQAQQVQTLTKASLHSAMNKPHPIKKKLQEAEHRKQEVTGLLKKELAHEQRLREQREEAACQREVKARLRERRQASARARRYYNDFELKLRSKLARQRNNEELIFRRLFKDGLEIQRTRIRELRQYAKEKKNEYATKFQENVDSLENYYRNQFTMLAETLEREQRNQTIRQHAQARAVDQMKRELRKKMEADIALLQEALECNDREDAAHVRELEAERLRDHLRLASYPICF